MDAPHVVHTTKSEVYHIHIGCVSAKWWSLAGGGCATNRISLLNIEQYFTQKDSLVLFLLVFLCKFVIKKLNFCKQMKKSFTLKKNLQTRSPI